MEVPNSNPARRWMYKNIIKIKMSEYFADRFKNIVIFTDPDFGKNYNTICNEFM